MIEEYRKIVLAFNKLPKSKANRTFMEISGYPHYENVSSNILGFYFDPSAEHGLKDLMLIALLRVMGEEPSSLGDVSIQREYGSPNGGRIDLLIDCESYVVGIENKIFANLFNDLADYSNAINHIINAKSGEARKSFKVVLGLKHIQAPSVQKSLQENNFVSITYEEIWREVKVMLGHYIMDAAPKWVTYLVDFMETTSNLVGDGMELTQTDMFLIEHHTAIDSLLSERNKLQDRLRQRMEVLANMMEGTDEVAMLDRPPYISSNVRLVLDFGTKLADNYEISFDLYLTPAGWDLQLFGRGNESYQYLLNLKSKTTLKEKLTNATPMDSGKRFSVGRWTVETPLENIRDALFSWIHSIHDAAKAI